jgi:hypothetical protein
MLTSTYITQLTDAVVALGQLGDDDTRRVSAQLAIALSPTVRNVISDVVCEMADELRRDHQIHVTVTVTADSLELSPAVTAPIESPAPDAVSGDKTARFALRLSEELKSSVETAAQHSGVSVNTWIVRTLHSAVSTPEVRPTRGSSVRGRGRA